MKSKAKRIAITVIASLMLNICLSGCWNSRELNTLAFITSMGFDKTEKGTLLTVQVLNPRAIAAQKFVDEPAVVVITQEGKDPFEMIRAMITQSSRKLNGTHLRTVIFSEDYAKDGISDVMDFLAREHQFRTDVYFAVAKGSTANEILNTLTKLEVNPSEKLYASIKASDEIWAGTKSEKTIDLINSIISDGKDPVLTGVKLKGHDTTYNSTDKLKDIKGGPITISDLAVFKGDKFVGWLNEEESKGYNYLTGHVKSSVGFIESKEIGKFSLEVTDVKTKHRASVEKGKPSITVDIDVMANIESASTDMDITKEKNIEKIEALAEKKLEKFCNKAIDKAQDEFGTDIFGFGEVIHRADPKLWNASLKEDWNRAFKDLPVKVNLTVEINRTGTISNSFFIKEKK